MILVMSRFGQFGGFLFVTSFVGLAFAQAEAPPTPPPAPAQAAPPAEAPPAPAPPADTAKPQDPNQPATAVPPDPNAPPTSAQTPPTPTPPPEQTVPPAEPPRSAVAAPTSPAPADTDVEPEALPQKDSGPEKSKLLPRDFAALPLSLEFRFGLNARIGASDNGFTEEELYDTAVGLGGWLSWNKNYSVGLELEHSGLGRATGISGDNSVNASYSMSNLWLGTRFYPYRSERVDLFVGLRLGLGIQHLSATGTRHDGTVGAPAQTFSCSEVQGPDLGFSGGLGSAFRISRAASFFARGDFVGQRLSGEVLGSCAVGIGSVTSAAITGGFAYEFELDPQPTRSARNTH